MQSEESDETFEIGLELGRCIELLCDGAEFGGRQRQACTQLPRGGSEAASRTLWQTRHTRNLGANQRRTHCPRKRGLDATEDYKAQLELARQSILIRELFANFQKKNPVTDAEIKGEYDKFVAANGGKEYRARHILVEKEDEAKALIAELKKGGKFEDLAKKASKDPGSGANGGDLDWANAASYVPEFSNAMIKLEKGQLTETPVKSQFGFHIIRVDDVREAQLPKLDEVKPQITQQLTQSKLGKFQEDLRAKAKVQ